MKIVNFKAHGSTHALTAAFGSKWVYCGRPAPKVGLPGSPLANPVRRGDGAPGSTLPAYRAHLWKLVNSGDDAVGAALAELESDSVLVCWCDDPALCHCSVIAEVWHSLHGLEWTFKHVPYTGKPKNDPVLRSYNDRKGFQASSGLTADESKARWLGTPSVVGDAPTVPVFRRDYVPAGVHPRDHYTYRVLVVTDDRGLDIRLIQKKMAAILQRVPLDKLQIVVSDYDAQPVHRWLMSFDDDKRPSSRVFVPHWATMGGSAPTARDAQMLAYCTHVVIFAQFASTVDYWGAGGGPNVRVIGLPLRRAMVALGDAERVQIIFDWGSVDAWYRVMCKRASRRGLSVAQYVTRVREGLPLPAADRPVVEPSFTPVAAQTGRDRVTYTATNGDVWTFHKSVIGSGGRAADVSRLDVSAALRPAGAGVLAPMPAEQVAKLREKLAADVAKIRMG